MASLSAAHQSQHGTTAYRHFHQLNQSTVSGVVPTQLPLLFPSLAPSVDVSSVDPSFSVHHNLLLNHFLLSSAPSTSSSLLNPFTRSSLRPPYHSQTPHWLNLDGMAPLVKQFPSAAESFADRSLPQAKELGQQNQQQQCSVSSGVSSFSFSSSVSADSDGRSCSSGSCSGTHSLNMRQTNSDEQNANNDQIQTAQTAVQQHQRPQQIEPTQQKQKKLLVRDEAYWERRRKNNDAAKRSRDSRRKKEDEVAVRAVVLEQENLQLRFEVERLRTEIERHRIVAFGDTLIAATAENVGETSMGKMPISSAAITQLTTAATAMGMAKPILNT